MDYTDYTDYNEENSPFEFFPKDLKNLCESYDDTILYSKKTEKTVTFADIVQVFLQHFREIESIGTTKEWLKVAYWVDTIYTVLLFDLYYQKNKDEWANNHDCHKMLVEAEQRAIDCIAVQYNLSNDDESLIPSELSKLRGEYLPTDRESVKKLLSMYRRNMCITKFLMYWYSGEVDEYTAELDKVLEFSIKDTYERWQYWSNHVEDERTNVRLFEGDYWILLLVDAARKGRFARALQRLVAGYCTFIVQYNDKNPSGQMVDTLNELMRRNKRVFDDCYCETCEDIVESEGSDPQLFLEKDYYFDLYYSIVRTAPLDGWWRFCIQSDVFQEWLIRYGLPNGTEDEKKKAIECIARFVSNRFHEFKNGNLEIEPRKEYDSDCEYFYDDMSDEEFLAILDEDFE